MQTPARDSADNTRKKPRRGRGKGSAPNSARTTGDFWGSIDKLPAVEEVAITTDPTALARSLGRPPFSGHEAVSEYHLRTVYENATKLAEVLATAGELLAVREDDD